MKKTLLVLALVAAAVSGTAFARARISSDINSNQNKALNDTNYYKRTLRCYVMQFTSAQFTCTGSGGVGQAQCENSAGAVFWDAGRTGCNGCQKRYWVMQNVNFVATKVAFVAFTVGENLAWINLVRPDGTPRGIVMECNYSDHILDLL